MNYNAYTQSIPRRGRGLTRRSFLFSSLLGALMTSPMLRAQPQYPSHPLRLVVPFPAGTSPDIIARLWGERFSKLVGQPVVIDNKPGAATIIGAQAVATSTPDGHTLFWTVNNTFSINPFVYKRLPYSIENFVPISRVLSVPLVLLVSAESKVRSLDDLIQSARAAPGKLTYASPGIGTSIHLAMELLLKAAAISMTHVPYKDYFGPDLIAQRIDVGFDASTTAIGQLKGGKVRALGIASATRVDALKEIKPIAETFPGFVAESWHGVFAPTGTAEDIVTTINKYSSSIVSSAEFRQTLAGYGLVPIGGSSANFRKFLVEDAQAWSQIIRSNNITLD